MHWVGLEQYWQFLPQDPTLMNISLTAKDKKFIESPAAKVRSDELSLICILAKLEL